MTRPRERVPAGNLVLLALVAAVGISALVTLMLLADDARWAVVPPLALILGLVWLLATNLVRTLARTRLLHDRSPRSAGLAVLALEAAVSVGLLTALLALTGSGTWADRTLAALVGTAAAFATDRLVTARLLAADPQG